MWLKIKSTALGEKKKHDKFTWQSDWQLIPWIRNTDKVTFFFKDLGQCIVANVIYCWKIIKLSQFKVLHMEVDLFRNKPKKTYL